MKIKVMGHFKYVVNCSLPNLLEAEGFSTHSAIASRNLFQLATIIKLNYIDLFNFPFLFNSQKQ